MIVVSSRTGRACCQSVVSSAWWIQPTDVKTDSASVAAYSDTTAEYGSDDEKCTVHNSYCSHHSLVLDEVEDDRERDEDDNDCKEHDEGHAKEDGGKEGSTEVLGNEEQDTGYGKTDRGRAEQDRNYSPRAEQENKGELIVQTNGQWCCYVHVRCAMPYLLNNTTLCANWSLPWGVLRS